MQQIRTQASFLLSNSVQVPPFEQERKETLSEVPRFLRVNTLLAHKSVERPPVGATKFFERFLRCRRFTLCLQYHAPMSGSKHCYTISRAWADRSDLIVSRHIA